MSLFISFILKYISLYRKDMGMKMVAGIFESNITADRAVSSLLDEGFSKDDISLVMSDKTRDRLFSSTDDEANRVAKGGIFGAALGGILGALVAGLTTVGLIVLPGGSLLAVGPIISALYGAGAGGALGGLSGALISAGFAADEANRYEEEIKQGKVVVIVHTANEDKAIVAEAALSNSGAVVEAA
jgi:hypothetical protein